MNEGGKPYQGVNFLIDTCLLFVKITLVYSPTNKNWNYVVLGLLCACSGLTGPKKRLICPSTYHAYWHIQNHTWAYMYVTKIHLKHNQQQNVYMGSMAFINNTLTTVWPMDQPAHPCGILSPIGRLVWGAYYSHGCCYPEVYHTSCAVCPAGHWYLALLGTDIITWPCWALT